MASTKERIDVLLVELGYFTSREKAKAALMAGLVLVDNMPVDKSGTKIERTAEIKVKGSVHPYVSRGGLKLEKAIREFGLELEGRTMLDIGASTGGFTDCALQHGASHVYAIDVGYNQLDWSLRQDPRVTVMERINFRFITPEDIKGERADFASIDVSFISLKLILPPLAALLSPGSEVVALIKPQFEAGRDKVGKAGIVRDPAVHAEVLHNVLQAAESCGFELEGLTYSPITGGEGNIEFLARWKRSSMDSGQPEDLERGTVAERMENAIVQVVSEAGQTFSSGK